MKFGIGQPVPRTEDPILLRGAGRYTDDVNVDGQVYAVMVRSPYAHGIIKWIAIDAAAKPMPGVLGVYIWDDLAKAGIGMTKRRPWSPIARRLEQSRLKPAPGARYRQSAVCRRGLCRCRCRERRASQGCGRSGGARSRTAAGGHQHRRGDRAGRADIHDEAPGNVTLDYHFGDTDAVNAAFAKAAHVTKLTPKSQRIVVNPMEPRACVAEFKEGRYILYGLFARRVRPAPEPRQ